MKIKKFRIKNFKSIVDSGDCYVESDLTVFAGKNESGKSSILEALYSFNSNVAIAESAIPIGGNNVFPEISITFIVSVDEINNYFEQIKLESTTSKDLEINVIKLYPKKYTIDKISQENLHFSVEDELLIELTRKISELDTIIEEGYSKNVKRFGLNIYKMNLDNIDATLLQVQEYRKSYLQSAHNRIANTIVKTKHNDSLNSFIKLLQEYKNLNTNKNLELLIEQLPNFIFFNSFDDIIPNEIPFENLEDNQLINDLRIISDLNVPLLLSEDKRGKVQHGKELNIDINAEYSKFWIQDDSQIKINWDSDILQFWIEEDNRFYKPDERSKGKQWHLSFYIKVSARAIENKDNVLLIDEPGPYLHASAQNDIYGKLIELSKKSQIFFTTHSPYLMRNDELHRVRLVVKNNCYGKNSTCIENKIHALADKETLTPILTAIGLELSQGIQNVNYISNVVVEGPSDYFYIQGFKSLLGLKDFNIVFGGGSGNIGNIGAILSGWGCKVVYLFDNDQGKKDGSKNLKRNWHVNEEQILSVKKDAGAIEDIFSNADFKSSVLKENNEYDLTNSEYLKKEKKDKVLLARDFAANCKSGVVNLSDETINDVKQLFVRLSKCFEENY